MEIAVNHDLCDRGIELERRLEQRAGVTLDLPADVLELGEPGAGDIHACAHVGATVRIQRQLEPRVDL